MEKSNKSEVGRRDASFSSKWVCVCLWNIMKIIIKGNFVEFHSNDRYKKVVRYKPQYISGC